MTIKNQTNTIAGRNISELLSQCLGNDFSKYRKLWYRPESDFLPLSFPIHIDLELIDLCNLKCKMCIRNNPEYRKKQGFKINTGIKWSLEKFKKLIDYCAERGTKAINLGSGAEPLMHRQCIEMIRYAARKGFLDIILITNGQLLTHELSEEILDSGLTRLYISLDAFTETTYSEIRGAKLKTVHDNILYFLNKRIQRKSQLPVVRVSFIDMPENRHEKQAFIDYWQKYVDAIDIQIYQNPVSEAAKINLTATKKFNCVSPFRRLSIRANGDILPCCDDIYGEHLKLGNINNITLEEAWNSDLIKKVRKGVIDDSIHICAACQRC